jgi:hypothetical protein
VSADIHFYFDPVCPFAWMTSKWVRLVQARRAYDVEWRFISLRLVNADVDYEAQFPPEYEAGHTAGLRLLRVAARARVEHGPAGVAATRWARSRTGTAEAGGSDGDAAAVRPLAIGPDARRRRRGPIPAVPLSRPCPRPGRTRRVRRRRR